MDTPLNASAIPAGTLFSGNTFTVPPYQREYAWDSEDIREFWSDLSTGLDEGSYFLGLVILTDDGPSKQVVDGQQRILTITLLAASVYHAAVRAGRKALADRLRADFLATIDYETDETRPRTRLSDSRDNGTLQALIESDEDPRLTVDDPEEVSARLIAASRILRDGLRDDLSPDPFKRIGSWADFLTNQVYFAVFVHPDPASAYRVFEVINTRGRELTTADLLKNYVISQAPDAQRSQRYQEWQEIARPLSPQSGPSSLVQFIRHVVTLNAGHVPPRDLFAYLADRDRQRKDKRVPPTAHELMTLLQARLPLYLQMVDPTLDGPADPSWLSVFSAFQDLGVITVRPLLMAISDADDSARGMHEVLKLVVRRIVVGNLGTGNVERRLSEAARRVTRAGNWHVALQDLDDLNPARQDFVEQCRKRSFNKATLTFLHRSVLQATLTPDDDGVLHLIRTRQATGWQGFPEDEFSYWGSTIGNTILANAGRRPKGAASWPGFQDNLLPLALSDRDQVSLESLDRWDTEAVEARGRTLGEEAADLWYGEEE